MEAAVPVPVPIAGLAVIALPTAASRQREGARAQLRLAVAALLDRLLPGQRHALIARAGQAPRIVAAGRDIGCSFSHEADWSLAAVHLHGRVGVDLMRVQAVPDWEGVARDYLGPDAARRLRQVDPALRPAAFARAWTTREACLKCQGLPLAEWTAEKLPCTVFELTMPTGMVGMLAVPSLIIQ